MLKGRRMALKPSSCHLRATGNKQGRRLWEDNTGDYVTAGELRILRRAAAMGQRIAMRPSKCHLQAEGRRWAAVSQGTKGNGSGLCISACRW